MVRPRLDSVEPLLLEAGLGRAAGVRLDDRALRDRRPRPDADHLGRVEHAGDERGPRRPPDGPPAGDAAGGRPLSGARGCRRDPLVRRHAADRRAGPAGGDGGRRLRAVRVQRRAPRRPRPGGALAHGVGPPGRGLRSALVGARAADRRRGHRPDGGRRRPEVDQRRRPRELPRRRGVHQPRRGQDAGPHRVLVRRAVRGPRGGRRAAVVRGRRGRPRGGRAGRRLPARDARSGRGIAEAGRGRLRAERRDPDRHRQHRVRREDRRHLPRRPGRWRSRWPAAPTSPPCTGTWSATCATAARCTATASCCRRDGKFL